MKRIAIVFSVILLIFTLNACGSEVDYYTISFDSQGGTEVKSQDHLYGDLAIEPKEPTKENYEFIGWYTTSNITDDSIVFDFSKQVIEDIVLFAYWEEIDSGIYTDTVETDYAVFEVIVDTIEMNDTKEILTVTVNMKMKVEIDHQLPVKAYGEKGIIEVKVLSKTEEDNFLFSEHHNDLNSSVLLNVHFEMGDIVSRNIRFTRNPTLFNLEEETAPIGHYQIVIGSWYPSIHYIYTDILINVSH